MIIYIYKTTTKIIEEKCKFLSKFYFFDSYDFYYYKNKMIFLLATWFLNKKQEKKSEKILTKL